MDGAGGSIIAVYDGWYGENMSCLLRMLVRGDLKGGELIGPRDWKQPVSLLCVCSRNVQGML